MCLGYGPDFTAFTPPLFFVADFTGRHVASRGFTVSGSRVFPSLREAIHSTATTGKLSMKGLSGELDWAPSELSMRTTLGGDSSRPFPFDDGRLVTMMKAQNDFSPLFTLADQCGFELQPKKERVHEMVQELQRDLAAFIPKAQMIFEVPGFQFKPPKKGKAR